MTAFLSILNPTDSAWLDTFVKLPLATQDIFYTSEFCGWAQNSIHKHDEVLCASMESGSGILLYPFVKRNLAKVSGIDSFATYFDITSLYGRGGLIQSGATDRMKQIFFEQFLEYCYENSIICAFDRFHPVIGNETSTLPGESVWNVGGFVVVDLAPDEEIIFNSFKSSVRKDIRKGERNNIEIFCESNIDHVESFIEIYYSTMKRNAANNFYYFSPDCFKSLIKYMPGKFHFFYAKHNGKIVSCELVLYHGNYCHSFLGGTMEEALPLAANPKLKYELIKFYKSLGCKYFLLGGGSRPNDGIFNFKKAYAPNLVYESFIGGSVLDAKVYNSLKDLLLTSNPQRRLDRFQFYEIF